MGRLCREHRDVIHAFKKLWPLCREWVRGQKRTLMNQLRGCGIHERLRHPRKGCFQGPGTWQWKSEGLDVRIWERIRKSKEPLGYAYPKFLKSFLNQKITSSFKWIYEVQISGCKDHKILKRKMWNMSKIYCNWKTVGHPEMLKERSPPGA